MSTENTTFSILNNENIVDNSDDDPSNKTDDKSLIDTDSNALLGISQTEFLTGIKRKTISSIPNNENIVDHSDADLSNKTDDKPFIDTDNNALLGISQTEFLTGIKRKTLRRWWEKGKFPKPTDFNSRLYWRKTIIAQWLDANFGGASND